MTKRQELELLAETAAKLGPDSYCGPWLTKILPEVERDIRSDFFPMHSPEEVRKEANKIVDDAWAEARRIIGEARAQETAIRTKTTNTIKERIDEAVQRLLNYKHALT